MRKIIDIGNFNQKKRDELLSYDIYKEKCDDIVETFDVVGDGLNKNQVHLNKIEPVKLMVATRRRSWDAIDFLSVQYSAGIEIKKIRNFYPEVLGYWESYAKYNEIYDSRQISESDRGFPHFELPGNDFDRVNRMMCFGILLGWDNAIPLLVPIIDFNNYQKDGMLERMLGFFVSSRPEPPDSCLRHLPYFKTLKIFSAAEKDRPALMAEYLDDWYHASRREPYYNAHTRDISFWGYWSWEAAAITFLLDIDDSSYASAQFYPKDLVDFARQARKDYAPEGSDPMAPNELRAKAGDPCPKAGLWQSLDVVPELRRYQQNEEMDNLGSVYGLTVWRLTEHEQ